MHLHSMAQQIQESSKEDAPSERAATDQLKAEIREICLQHGLSLSPALGSVTLEIVRLVIRTIVTAAVDSPHDAIEITVEKLGQVAEWAADLIMSEVPADRD